MASINLLEDYYSLTSSGVFSTQIPIPTGANRFELWYKIDNYNYNPIKRAIISITFKSPDKSDTTGLSIRPVFNLCVSENTGWNCITFDLPQTVNELSWIVLNGEYTVTWEMYVNTVEATVSVDKGLEYDTTGKLNVNPSTAEDSTLLTTSKTVTGAINEVFQSTTDAFNLFKSSIVSKGGTVAEPLNKTSINNGILSIKGGMVGSDGVTINGSIFGYTEDIGSIVNTITSSYYNASIVNGVNACWMPFEDISNLLLAAFNKCNHNYDVYTYKDLSGDGYVEHGIKIIKNEVIIKLYVMRSGVDIEVPWYINLNSSSTIQLYTKIENGSLGIARSSHSVLTRVGSENNYALQLKTAAYEFKSSCVWINDKAIWYTVSGIFLLSIGWYSKDYGMLTGPNNVSYGEIYVGKNLFTGIFPKYMDSTTMAQTGISLCQFTSVSDSQNINFDEFGVYINCKSGATGTLKVYLATDTSKYFYIRRWGAFFWIISTGTL